MQINPVSNHGIEARAPEPQNKTRAIHERGDSTEFSQSPIQNQVLSDAPEIRTEEVVRAQVLVSSLKYPPDELIGRIARLLALKQNRSDS